MNDDLLIQRFLDGTLTAAQGVDFNQRLRDDAALRDELLEITSQAVAVGDLARQRDLTDPMPTLQARPQRNRIAPWLQLAAGLAMLALIVVLVTGGSRHRAVLTVVDAVGSITWSQGAEGRTDVAIGQELAAGTIETVGESATALLKFRDGSLITLTADSQLSFSDEGQKHLVLHKGSLSAQVQPQPQDRPMLVRTSSAEAQVVGTVFNLSTRADETLLKVDEGLVKLRRLADGSSVNVPAKSLAVATLSSAAKLDATATPEPLSEWGFDFTQALPPRDWRGISDGSTMRASPYVAQRKPSGTVITHFGISVRTAQLQPAVSLIATDRSVIRYRLRQNEQRPLQLMLLTSRAGGGYGGNFEAKIGIDQLQPDADGWCELSVPIAAFRPLSSRHPSPIGHILTSALLSSFTTDTQLEVAHFELQSPP